mmetsp:Transcript_11235/g.24798  ORF Transcript_11235/g.24798 Transcript_11235/m.24798 type:complete len:256 (-) Transcript_11235:301-1068(-)
MSTATIPNWRGRLYSGHVIPSQLLSARLDQFFEDGGRQRNGAIRFAPDRLQGQNQLAKEQDRTGQSQESEHYKDIEKSRLDLEKWHRSKQHGRRDKGSTKQHQGAKAQLCVAQTMYQASRDVARELIPETVKTSDQHSKGHGGSETKDRAQLNQGESGEGCTSIFMSLQQVYHCKKRAQDEDLRNHGGNSHHFQPPQATRVLLRIQSVNQIDRFSTNVPIDEHQDTHVVSDVAHSKEHKVWNAVGVIEVWISYSD